jgi:iron complex outermembrane receptor protein/outer membrane receptor for ferrienterochelin and colicins
MMIAKDFKWGSVVLNCENLGDYRQSKIESLYTGNIQNPAFKGIWAPIDGRILNLSLKVNL